MSKLSNLTRKIVIIAIAVVSISAKAQGQKIYTSPDAVDLARQHKIIAIAPPVISFASMKNVDAEAIKEQQKTESLNFQREIYSWLLKRKSQGKFAQEIQELAVTNAKLQQAGYPEKILSAAEMCEILNVDGILTSNYTLSNPISAGGAVALRLATGVSATTNTVDVAMSIHDKSRSKMIWNYNRKISGKLGSTPASLVDTNLRHASKKMPYFLKK